MASGWRNNISVPVGVQSDIGGATPCNSSSENQLSCGTDKRIHAKRKQNGGTCLKPQQNACYRLEQPDQCGQQEQVEELPAPQPGFVGYVRGVIQNQLRDAEWNANRDRTARRKLIRPCEHHTTFGVLATCNTCSRLSIVAGGNTADRRLRVGFDFLLAICRTAPMAPEKTSGTVEYFVESLVLIHLVGVRFPKVQSPLVQPTLNRTERLVYFLTQALL